MEQSFHHRGQFDKKPKAHKHKGRSKPSALNKPQGRIVDGSHRVSSFLGHDRQYHDIGKAQRQALGRERRKNHREQLIKKRLQYYGEIKGGIPKIVAIVPLSPYSKTRQIRTNLLKYCNVQNTKFIDGVIHCSATIGSRSCNFCFWECKRDLWSVLDICKVADIILLVASNAPSATSSNSNQQKNDLYIDELGKKFCSLIRNEGVPNIIGLFQPKYEKERERISNKKLQSKIDQHIKYIYNKFLVNEFGNTNLSNINNSIKGDKSSSYSGKDIKILNCYDSEQIFRFMDICKHNEIEWKTKRSFLLGDQCEFIPNPTDNEKGTLKVYGYLRGQRNLDVNRPIHITGVGDFLLSQIDGLRSTPPKKVQLLPSEKRAMKKQERRANQSVKSNSSTNKNDDINIDIDIDIDDNDDNDNDNHNNDNDNNNNKESGNNNNNNNDNVNNNNNQVQDVDIEMKQDKNKENNNDSFTLVKALDSEQDDLNPLRPLDNLATFQDQSIITDQELENIEKENQKKQQRLKKKLELEKQGLSDYRLDWDELIGWGSNSDNDNHNDNDNDNDNNNNNNNNNDNNNDNWESADINELIEDTKALTLTDKEKKDMENDPTEILAKKKKLEREEFEFTDEVDTPLNIPARDKFAQYRGLKSFHTTRWNKFELLPLEYSRIYQINNWNYAIKQSKLPSMDNGIKPGGRVCLYIKDVPTKAKKLWESPGKNPLLVWGLLPYENKISVCHYLVKKCNNYTLPVQGLDSYIFDIGFRRFISRPIFSEYSKNDKHLVQKFLKANEFTVVSVYAPITYPPMPVLMFEDPDSPLAQIKADDIVEEDTKSSIGGMSTISHINDNNNNNNDNMDIYDSDHERELKQEKLKVNPLLINHFGKLTKPIDLIAIGHLLEVNAHRLLIKRKILSGSPIRVHRRRAVVRYMFWNSKDVKYFKPLDIWTKHGLKGKIEESVGEKGYMKCFFNGLVKGHDVVCLSLYKRIFPIPSFDVFGST